MTSLFNSSQEIVFVLHGLNDTQTNKHIYFAFILILYVFTIFLNLTLISAVCLEKMLNNPMYLLLCNLCLNGIIGASAFYPVILHHLFFNSHVLTYIGCLIQIFIIFFYVHCEFNTLTVMAYDRYVAICKPLHYHSILTIKRVRILLLLTWLFSWLDCSIGVGILVRLPLCGVDIDKLYCSPLALLKLSCVDTTIDNIHSYVLSCFHVCQVIFILISYVNIIKASFRSKAHRRKFMQTCLPHLITLTNFLISLLFDAMYARYGSSTGLLALKNIMAMEFLVVPPLLNPIIYGMILTQIRHRFIQLFKRKVAVLK